ncbi:MAG: hypothetical protein ABIQ35_02480 [Verrucomicrobiota bacterium]
MQLAFCFVETLSIPSSAKLGRARLLFKAYRSNWPFSLANATVANQLTVNGTFDPNETPTFTVTGSGKIAINANGKLLVKASTFAGQG